MQKHFYAQLFFALFLSPLFSQNTYKKDTLIYQNQGVPYRLIPKWTAGNSDTFKFSQTSLFVRRGDTIFHGTMNSQIVHQVKQITDTAIFQTAKLGKELYYQRVGSGRDVPENPLIKDFFTVEYQTDVNGTNIKITNCADVQKYLIPDLEKTLKLLQLRNDESVGRFRDYLNSMKDCKGVQNYLTVELEKLHEFYTQLVPSKGDLKYRVRLTDTTDTTNEFNIYFQVHSETKENGNLVFEFSEDKTMGPTVFDNLAKSLTNTFRKANRIKRAKPDPYEVDEGKLTIEVNSAYYPVRVQWRSYSERKRKEGLEVNLYEVKLEKINH